MKTESADQRLSELLVVLDRLTELHRDLLGAVRDKIEHMRSGDTAQLQADAVRHESLLKTIHEQEGLRRQLMDAVGRGYGISPQVARRMPARQLAERIEGRLRSGLLEAAERLRGVVREASEVNRVAVLIAQQVLHHLRCVFEAVAAPEGRPDIYSPHGTVVPSGTRRLFEMTG